MIPALTREAPEYRALMLFDHVPDGCITHLVTDAYNDPHVRPGEFVVVDTADRAARSGEVYLIQWDSGGRNVGQASQRPARCRNRQGEVDWSFHSIRNPARAATLHQALRHHQQGRAVPELDRLLANAGWSDGPYKCLDYLQSKIVGVVIGIYAPHFDEPTRRRAA